MNGLCPVASISMSARPLVGERQLGYRSARVNHLPRRDHVSAASTDGVKHSIFGSLRYTPAFKVLTGLKRVQFRSHKNSSTVPGLGIQVLRGKHERSKIEPLRRHAAFGVEADLGLELAQFEQLRDEVGIVTAISLGERVIATIRFVPTGRNLTAAERLTSGLVTNKKIFDSRSWEVGRIIMNPEDRDPELLPRCLALALGQLLKERRVEYLHATTTMAMARLWRRFGMKIDVTTLGASGEKYALICGQASDVAAALNVPVPVVKTDVASSRLAWNPWSMSPLRPLAPSF